MILVALDSSEEGEENEIGVGGFGWEMTSLGPNRFFGVLLESHESGEENEIGLV